MKLSSLACALLACAVSLSLIGAAAAAAESYIDRVSADTQRVYVKDEKGRVVVLVTNKSNETLDIDVSCTFFMGTTKAGTGTGTTSRLPPHRSDTLDIPDRQTLPFNTAHCDIARAEK
jgi:hypothetical protein